MENVADYGAEQHRGPGICLKANPQGASLQIGLIYESDMSGLDVVIALITERVQV